MNKRYTVFLAPDLIGEPGGIARVCTLICRALSDANENFVALSMHDATAAATEAAKVFPRMEYVPCNGSRLKFVLGGAVKALRRKPAVVLAAHPYFSHVTYLIARMVGARSVVMIHGTDAWQTLSWFRRWGLRRVDLILSVSQFTADQAARANGIDLKKVRVLHNCLDPTLPASPQQNGKQAGLSLLTVARIHRAESKGHDQVIRSLPKLLTEFPQLKYSIVGDGDGRPELERLAAKEGVAHAVQFHGRVSEQELVRQYAQATIFIMPSTGEGFGLAFIEAMAQGKPAIGGNVDAAPEVIKDGQTGYVVNPSSTEDISDRVRSLLSDPALRKQMGASAVLDVQTRFAYATFKKRLLEQLFPAEASN